MEESEPTCSFDAEVIDHTPKALLCRVSVAKGDPKTVWIPRKAIHDDSEVWNSTTTEGTLVIPTWLARSKGLS